MKTVLLSIIIAGFFTGLQPCPAYGSLKDPFSVDLGAWRPAPDHPDKITGSLTITLDPGYTLLAPGIFAPDKGDIFDLGLKIIPENSPNVTDFRVKWPKPDQKKTGSTTAFVYKNTVTIPFVARMISVDEPLNLNLRLVGILCKTLCIPIDRIYTVPFGDFVVAGDDAGYGLMLLFAFLGGVILNFMPCVLPVLSLKLKALTRTQKTAPGYSLRRGMMYSAAGILTTFFLFGLMAFVLDYIGEESGWGLHFQNPFFLFFLCLITTLFAANLAGGLDFSLSPSVQTKMAHILGRAHNTAAFYIEDYLSGVFATFLATPCTAPLLGTALGYAFTLTSSHLFLFFCVIGLGFSAPYWVGALLPDRYVSLPKPGPWMDYLSKTVAAMIFFGVIWLLWVLNSVGGPEWGISAAVGIGILGALLVAQKWGIIGRRIVFFSLGLLIIGPFFITSSPSLILPGAVKNNGSWETYSPELLKQYQQENQVIFLDITADWCVTCQLNKHRTLDTAQTQNLFQSQKVRLIRADFTRRNPTIARALKTYDRVGIPFNIVFGPGAPHGVVLPEIINHDDIVHAVNAASGILKK